MAIQDPNGCRLIGFDEEGYPVVERGYSRLPEGWQMKRKYGISVKPMVLAPTLTKAAATAPSMNLPITAKPKPSPGPPAAPDDLPEGYDFCVQQDGDGTRFLRFRDPSHKYHGMDVTASSQCGYDESKGMLMCHGGGGDFFWDAPVCTMEAGVKERVPSSCCVDMQSSTLVCPGASYDGLTVEILPKSDQNIGGVAHVSVAHPDLPGGVLRPVPVCEPPEVDVPEEKPCCIEEQTGMIVCAGGSAASDLAGKTIPLEYLKFYDDPDGSRVAFVDCGQLGSGPESEIQAQLMKLCGSVGGFKFPVCEKARPPITPIPFPKPGPDIVPVPIPDEDLVPVPEEPVPDLCCFEPNSSSIVCEGTKFHGLVVKVVASTTLPSGLEIVSVEHPDLPGGGARLPICTPPPEVPPEIEELPEIPDTEIPKFPEEEPEPEIEPEPEPEEPPVEDVPDLPPPSPGVPDHCCYDYAKGTIDCPGTNLHGLKVRLITEGAVQNGWRMVKVEHPRLPGGHAVMPECPTDCQDRPRRAPDGPTCEDRWNRRMTKLERQLSEESSKNCPGRRYARLVEDIQCVGGIGISDDNKTYARWPGMRGGVTRPRSV